MKLQPIIIVITGLLISCSNSTNSDRLESREMYAFKTRHSGAFTDSIVFRQSYQLQILDLDTVRIYRYLNSIDSTKNITFKFNPQKEILTFGPFVFEKTELDFFENIKISKEQFDLYDLKIPVTDGNGPMLFNQQYGVLNLDNSYWTYHYLFLPEGQENDEIAEQILRKLKEK